jgi:hypothetical protein
MIDVTGWQWLNEPKSWSAGDRDMAPPSASRLGPRVAGASPLPDLARRIG